MSSDLPRFLLATTLTLLMRWEPVLAPLCLITSASVLSDRNAVVLMLKHFCTGAMMLYSAASYRSR